MRVIVAKMHIVYTKINYKKELLMNLIMVTHSITIVKINSLLFSIPCTYNQYQMFILFMCPCLWICEFSSCISINGIGFIDLHSSVYFQVGCIVE